ncbi:Gfo/Idh/MocA family protein [Aestuariibius sp. 2305UL40-4]|uniref:Gfo/Idh/MocA family protein n=1 Tax=Aestuariibius violaceus TaxID=3234132 RepID=UPI00345E92B5
MESVRWGILGAAKFALTDMAPAIHAARGAELVALATSSPEKAAPFQAFAPGVRVVGYDALLADPEVDAVYIPLPNHLHVDWTLKALAAGKHVLCEKPLAMEAGDFDRVIAARNKAGRLAAEAYMILHHPQWQHIRNLIEDKAIGRLRHVQALFAYNNASDTGNIRNDAAKGGGGIPDIGVYIYGSTRFATGQEPEEIVSARIEWENGVDVVANVSAQFQGFTAQWLTSMRMHRHQEMTFLGEDGVIRLNAPFRPLTFTEPKVELRRGDAFEVWRYPAINQYVRQVEAFCRSVREGTDYPCPLEFSKGTQVVIDRVFEKARETG